jgi:SIR2-like domain
MQSVLLLGAGFSRNWGGWLASEAFEYLLGCPEILRNPHLLGLLWRNQPTGGFENALAQAQADFIRDPAANTNHLVDLQNAVARMFDNMNQGFFGLVDFEFQQAREMMVRTFLTRFDAIFTLNQDLLLEHHYIDQDVCLLSSRRWGGSALPGMTPTPIPGAANPHSWAQRNWTPANPAEFTLDVRYQPYFKLHGSSNWQEVHGAPMLIMGGNKIREIGLSPVLSWYHQQFEERLCQGGTRVMVIGYGFRDTHINEVIMRAVNERGLKMFIIAPEGGDLARTINPTHRAPIRVGTDLETTFERGLIGASRRSLRETFGNDTIEHAKVMRFFQA